MMNDNDIKKGLGCLSGNVIFCADCGYSNNGRCKESVAKDALDLINRLKLEIAELQNQIAELQNQIAEYELDAELEYERGVMLDER